MLSTYRLIEDEPTADTPPIIVPKFITVASGKDEANMEKENQGDYLVDNWTITSTESGLTRRREQLAAGAFVVPFSINNIHDDINKIHAFFPWDTAAVQNFLTVAYTVPRALACTNLRVRVRDLLLRTEVNKPGHNFIAAAKPIHSDVRPSWFPLTEYLCDAYWDFITFTAHILGSVLRFVISPVRTECKPWTDLFYCAAPILSGRSAFGPSVTCFIPAVYAYKICKQDFFISSNRRCPQNSFVLRVENKPSDVQQFMSDKVIELTDSVSGVQHIATIRLPCITCNSPAGAFLQQVCFTYCVQNTKANTISQDPFDFILNALITVYLNYITENLERNYSMLQKLHVKLDSLVSASSSEPKNEHLLPFSYMDELNKYEEVLRDGARYADLKSADWMRELPYPDADPQQKSLQARYQVRI
ncbi:hypothetical protein CLF_104800 [Clonorchis sinensis]|uniref:Uncharacterized protein n=1 Tax=Clonorchis sinensis TaxID=79923 RepID=G7YCD2_CLOSI|nr:hypothetical protein CLF_104800 [Clonorchis sinensis]